MSRFVQIDYYKIIALTLVQNRNLICLLPVIPAMDLAGIQPGRASGARPKQLKAL